MASEATPRISAHLIPDFMNQRVRIVGRVIQLAGETATLDAEGNVTIMLSPESHLTVGNAAEIIGRVKGDQSIQVMQATDFGSNFDYAAANAVVAATHKYKEIFYEAPQQSY